MLNRNVLYGIVLVLTFAIGALAGVVGSNALFAGSGEASEQISAPTLDPNVLPTISYSQLQATNEALVTIIESLNNQQVTPQPPSDDSAIESTEQQPSTEATDQPTTDTSANVTAAERVLFRIVPEQSEARFKIDETLAGNDIVVTGTTNQVAGDLVLDFTTPANSQVGNIRINVRTLATDNRFRDDAIRSRVLQSARDEYEFSEFIPTDIIGLPDSLTLGETATFQVVGDLTVRDVTRPVTFDAQVTVVDENTITGFASTVILYRDFNLNIPQPPNVSFIGDEVTLEIDLTATRVQ
jgi:polyisoprenoid-binding protein YceI